MKRIVTLSLMLLASMAMYSQPETMRGFVAAGGTQGEVHAVVGQPFAWIVSSGGYEVSAGLAQAQLVVVEIDVTREYGTGYNANGFVYPPDTPPGVYHYTVYSPNGTEFNYDLVTVLNLTVTNAIACGDTVYDGNNNAYATVMVAGYCWTKSNLKATHYADGATEVERVFVYKSDMHPDEDLNLETYGRLYTWHSAVNVGEGSAGVPPADADGNVQGICPYGWHIPTVAEMSALNALATEELRSTELWLQPNANTNSSGFTSLPAGMYNGEKGRFEGLLSYAGYWSVENSGTDVVPTAHGISYHCSVGDEVQPSGSNAMSVRCVRNF